MPGKRAKRLKLIQDLAERREQAAAAALAAARQQLAAERARLAELQGYRAEYHRGRGLSTGGGISAAQLRNLKHFTGRLHAAVEQQEAVIQRLVAESERCEAHWRHTRARRAALEKLRERYQSAEQQRLDRRDQAATDEHAARITRRRGEG